ncbi:MAG: hypothetical protein KDD55_09820, partial [Bdellovibrionales bacterium]|nr:hypothetical protein [Bdellovibrionales bacterium]
HFGLIKLKSIRAIFNIELEGSLANWVSSLVYLSVGLSLWGITWCVSRELRWSFRTLSWGFLATVFTYLAADDGAEIHEAVGTALKEYTTQSDWEPRYSFVHWVVDVFPSYYWQAVFTPIFVLVGLFMVYHLYREFGEKWLLLLVFLGFGCFVFAQGLDYLEGAKYSFRPLRSMFDLDRNTVRHFQKALEEFLEMFGMTLLLYAFLRHLSSLMEGAQLSFHAQTKSRKDES